MLRKIEGFLRPKSPASPVTTSAPTRAPGAPGATPKSTAIVLSPSAVQPGASALIDRPIDSKGLTPRPLHSRSAEALAPHAAAAVVPGGKTQKAPDFKVLQGTPAQAAEVPSRPLTREEEEEEGAAPDSTLLRQQRLYGVEHGREIRRTDLKYLLRGERIESEVQRLPEMDRLRRPPNGLVFHESGTETRKQAFQRAIRVLGGERMGTIRQAQVVRAAAELFLNPGRREVSDGKQDFGLFIDKLAKHFNLQRGDSEGYQAFCRNCLAQIPMDSLHSNPLARDAIKAALQSVGQDLGVTPFEWADAAQAAQNG